MESEKTKEKRLRRALARKGYELRKDRARNYSVDHAGGYMIVDPNRGMIEAGEKYNLELVDVEAFLNE